MKFDGITIISDMDGTLLTDGKRISAENIAAVNYFRENGGVFTIASGRIYNKILIYSHLLNLDLPIISHNGAVIYDTLSDKIIHHEFLEGDYRGLISEIYEKYPYIGVEAYTESDVRFLKHNKYIDWHIADEKFAMGGENQQIRWYGFYETDEKWCKILMAMSKKDCDFFEKTLPKEYPEYKFVRSEAHYYEILPWGANKGSAAAKLMEFIGKPMDKLYAIGDNMNDKELIKTAKTGVAVKNAAAGLKEAADIVLDCTNEENAVAKLIYEVIE
jgi:Cof subfamily protein (haloacid dehalogenase superfamily)